MTSATTGPRRPASPIPLERRGFGEIARADWERLHRATPHATPFSRWTFHRAWWDAYGETAEDAYLVLDAVADGAGLPGPAPATARDPWDPRPTSGSSRGVTEADPGDPRAASEGGRTLRAIIPLMVREAPGNGRVLYMGASYHADYAAILAAPADLPSAIGAFAATFTAGEGALPSGVDRADLRRLRAIDPTPALLGSALGSHAVSRGWRAERSREDVCPVLTLASDWESQLAAMSRVARHELRRKLRRADRTGAIRLRHVPLGQPAIARFVELHQARWGARGLFAHPADGERARTFFHRLTELEAAEGSDAQLLFAELSVEDRVVSSLVAFDDRTTCYFYNAGMDPAARDLSPGILATAMLIRDRLESGTRRFDFLRGDERYKYEWGAVDEPIERVVVHREA